MLKEAKVSKASKCMFMTSKRKQVRTPTKTSDDCQTLRARYNST